MNLKVFRSEVKYKPRKLTQIDRGNITKDWGIETWLVIKDTNTISFNYIVPDHPLGICKFTTICMPGDSIKCSHGPDGYKIEIENHPDEQTTLFNHFIFSD